LAEIGTNPDAELLALGARVEPIIQEWQAKRAIDEQRREAWEAACEHAGLPRISDRNLPDDEWREYQEKRGSVRPEGEEKEEVDEDGCSVVWNSILNRIWPLIDEILSRDAKTVSGLTVQVRAIVVATCGLDDLEGAEGEFIKAVCAFVGLTRMPEMTAVSS
jgi:hypothetical protein